MSNVCIATGKSHSIHLSHNFVLVLFSLGKIVWAFGESNLEHPSSTVQLINRFITDLILLCGNALKFLFSLRSNLINTTENLIVGGICPIFLTEYTYLMVIFVAFFPVDFKSMELRT